MGCLPESGGCERQRTDPFVNHLNWLEGTNYVDKVCLDVIDRNTHQPDGMFDWIDDDEQGWTLEKLSPPSELTDAVNPELKPANS